MPYENLAEHSPNFNETDVTIETQGGATFNPMTGLTGQDRFVYVLFKLSDARTRPTRVITSPDAPESWRLGSVITLYDKVKGGSDLGRYKIVGLRDIHTDESAGDVPDVNNIKWGRIDHVW